MYKQKEALGGEIGFVPQMINVGGMTDIVWLFPCEKIAEMPPPLGALAQWGWARFKDSPSHIILKPAPDSMKASDSFQQSANGGFWQGSIVFDTPMDGLEVSSFIEQNAEAEFVAIVRDANGVSKIYGNLETPFRLTVLEKDPGTPGGNNKYFWTLAGETKKPACTLPYDALEMGYVYYGGKPWLTKKRNVFTNDFASQFSDENAYFYLM